MALTAILVDDEYANSQVLEYELRRLRHSVEITGIYDDPVEALKAVRSRAPDILFLDIEMPKINGFELLDILGQDLSSHVIFVTAYNQYAIKAFEYYAIDYLVKPVDARRLKQAIDKSITLPRTINNQELAEVAEIVDQRKDVPQKIVVPISNGYQMIQVNDIVRCEADNNYTHVHLVGRGRLVVSRSLKHFERLLEHADFLRVHQSHLVHMQYVTQYVKSSGGHLKIEDESAVPVSRGQKQAVIDYFKTKSV